MMSTGGRVGVQNPHVVHLKLISCCVFANWNLNKSLRKGSRTPPSHCSKATVMGMYPGSYLGNYCLEANAIVRLSSYPQARVKPSTGHVSGDNDNSKYHLLNTFGLTTTPVGWGVGF